MGAWCDRHLNSEEAAALDVVNRRLLARSDCNSLRTSAAYCTFDGRLDGFETLEILAAYIACVS